MSVIYGFAGMRDSGDTLCFSPRLPTGLDEISFKINYLSCLLSVVITPEKVTYELLKGDSLKLFNYYDGIHLVSGKRMIIPLQPELRAVLIDHQSDDNIDNLVSEVEAAGIKCIVLTEPDSIVPPPDPELFLASAELLKERRWDCLGITTRDEGETALKSAEMASIRVINIKDLTLNGIRLIHEEFSLNWNRGINYP